MLIQNTNPLAVAPASGEGPARLRPRRPVRLRARAVPDRHRALCRRRAAGDDVPRARRPLHRAAATNICSSPQGDRPAAGLPLQSRGRSPRSPNASAPTHPAFAMTPREIIDWTLQAIRLRRPRELWRRGAGSICSRRFEEAHFLDGFGFPDGKFRFKPDWTRRPSPTTACAAPWRDMPALPDHWPVNEAADDAASVQAGDFALPQLPQFHLHRDADLARCASGGPSC